MIHIQVESWDKEIDYSLAFVGSKDYYIYNPYAKALRMLADEIEHRDFQNRAKGLRINGEGK